MLLPLMSMNFYTHKKCENVTQFFFYKNIV